jgi:HEAT repeat protein
VTRGVASTPDASARLRALLDCGDSLAALVAAIDDPSEDIVRHALRRLTRPELPADARSRLRSALAAAPPSLAPDYARVLAVCRDGRAVTEAIGRLAGHSYTTRLAAARALAVLADARAADALREAVDDEVAGVCGQRSTRSLGSAAPTYSSAPRPKGSCGRFVTRRGERR